MHTKKVGESELVHINMLQYFRVGMRPIAPRTKSGTRRSSSGAKTASSRGPSPRSSPGSSASAAALEAEEGARPSSSYRL